MVRLQSDKEGLIYIKQSLIINICRPNSLSGAKVLGKPVVINSKQVVFLSHNVDGHVTFFMTNGFEICLNVYFDEAEKIFNCALGGINYEIS